MYLVRIPKTVIERSKQTHYQSQQHIMKQIAAFLVTAFFVLLPSLTDLHAQQPGTSPVKIFILAGQSNMEGQGEISPVTTPGTLRHTVANDPTGTYQFVVDGVGNWVVRDDVWIRDESPAQGGLTAGYGATTGTIGPELGFGHLMGDRNEHQVLLVKAAWGGKSLAVDFRPPSSGGTTGFYYNEIKRLVNEATTNLATYFPNYNGGGYEIVGFGWHQGWNDRVTPTYAAEYETNMANFIRDMRSSAHGLNAPNMKFVIATTGMDGGNTYTTVEQAQLAMANTTTYPDFAGNVSVIDTRTTYKGFQFWQTEQFSPAAEGYHWNRNAKTYLNIGLAMGDAMSILAPGRCPFGPSAIGGPSGVTVTWQNGTETPTSVRILRNGVEIASAAPATPSSFLDTTALPGVLNYELIFTMPVTPCPSLTATLNGGVTDLKISSAAGSFVLNWTNNMTYPGIEVRRDGTLLGTALSGSAITYTDTAPPTSGIVTYTVAPTSGNSTPASAQINLNLGCTLGILNPAFANGGINPATGSAWAVGDSYRLAFVTSTSTQATATDITTYNNFVQSVATAAGLGSATWKVIASTQAVSARDNTATHPGTNGAGSAVFLMDGSTLFATGNNDLWNGANVPLNLNEQGNPSTAGTVFAGTFVDGTGEPIRYLGTTIPDPTAVVVQTGSAILNGTGWIRVFNAPATASNPVYALSDPLFVVDLAETTPPTVISFADDKSGGPIVAGSTVNYTVTFSETMKAATVGTADFTNAATAAISVNSVTATANPAVFQVSVTPTGSGTLRLRVAPTATLEDLAGNLLNAATASPDDTLITVNAPPPLSCQLGVLDLAANGGVNPATGIPWAAGNTYRLVFVTSTTTQATSSDIATYNAFVQSAANASTAYPTLGSVTWKIVGSTATVDARDNTGTNPGSGTGVPVFLTNGATKIANNNTDLWDGISAAVNFNENGVLLNEDRAFTGTLSNGTKVTGTGDQPLGGTPNVRTGRSDNLNWMTDFNSPAASFNSVFAISDVLTIQAVSTPTPYQAWLGTFTFAPGDDTTPTGDPDGDGMSNQEEFAFGLNPTLGSSVNPIIQQLAGGIFQYTRTKDSGLTYKVYYSTTLSGWTWDEFASQIPAPAVGGVETVTVTLAAAAPANGRLFVRVEATPVPTP